MSSNAVSGDGAFTDAQVHGRVAGARTIIGSYLGSAVPERDVPMFAQMWRDGILPLETLIAIDCARRRSARNDDWTVVSPLTANSRVG